MLQGLYLASREHKWLYPIYLGLRMPLIFPTLAAREGFAGAVRWMGCRVGLLRGKKVTFHSRHGFNLSHLMEFVVYDEIFIEGCYKFKNLPGLLRGKPSVRLVDFGTHHGLFINYAQSLNPRVEAHGAEMSPVAYGFAAGRFAGQAGVTLRNVAIGGSARKERITLVAVSTTQSLNESGDVEVEVTTADECLRQWNILGRDIDLLKMDIEGAEKEVFENFPSISRTLAATKAIVMEIHGEPLAASITSRLASLGFRLDEKRGTNFFFIRDS
ncbi:MAG: FkbM family methyltransferase [Verrucomicrobiota bacterium]|jgi:FkbM family methyltransferase